MAALALVALITIDNTIGAILLDHAILIGKASNDPTGLLTSGAAMIRPILLPNRARPRLAGLACTWLDTAGTRDVQLPMMTPLNANTVVTAILAIRIGAPSPGRNLPDVQQGGRSIADLDLT